MNLKELKNTIDFTIERLHDYEDLNEIPVLITLSDKSIGSRASSIITYAGMGIDWEHGQFRIEPAKHLVSKGNSLVDIKSIVCRPFDSRNYYYCPRCEGKASKDDKYCRHCSQRLK